MDLYNQITENIYIGGYELLSNQEFFIEKNIKVVINCTKKAIYPNVENHLKDVSTKENIQRYRLALDDESESRRFMKMVPKGASIINKHIQNGDNILVYCKAGLNRSASIIAGYLILYRNMTPMDAVYHIREQRKSAISEKYIRLVLNQIYRNHLKEMRIESDDMSYVPSLPY